MSAPEASLPSHAGKRQDFDALAAVLEAWDPGSAVAWVAKPWLLALAQTMAGNPYRVPQQLSVARLRRELVRSNAASVVERPIPALSAGGALLLPATLNQERVMRPVAERLGAPLDAPRARAGTRLARSLGRDAIESWDRLAGAMRDAGAGATFTAVTGVRTLLSAARCLAYAEAMTVRDEPNAIVIGSSHNGPARAFVHVARRLGVPTVYLPHAPALTEARINDLPVDRAGLRGPEEVELYAGHGADRERLEVVGSPALDPREPPPIDESMPVVLAVSPVGRDNLRRQIELVHAALGDEVVLSPHPRSDHRGLREMSPPAWRVSSGLTYDLLAEGPPAVIQRSSGVSLEALLLGVPPIQIAYPGDRPGYPLIREPWVRSVSSPTELRDAVAACREVAADPARRRELIEWAHRWCWPLGDEAADRGAELVRAAAAAGASAEPIWDAWDEPE